MPLGMEVGLGTGDFVLDEDPGSQPPQFLDHVCCCQTAGWIKVPLGTEIVPAQGHCVRRGPSSHPPKKGAQPRNSRPISVVAKRLDGLRCHLVWS